MPLSFPANPSLNQTYVYNNITWTFNGNGWTKSGAGGASITVSGSAPNNPNNGALWFNSESGDTGVYFGNGWVAVGGGGGGGGVAEVYDVNSTSTGYFDLPSGTTAQRPASPQPGMIRHNSSLDAFEFYTTASGWIPVQSLGISNVFPTSFNGASGTSFIVTGNGFVSGCTVGIITYAGNIVTPATVAVNNLNTITFTTPRVFNVTEEPLSVRVTAPTGLSVTLSNAIDCGGSPNWANAAGSLGTVIEDVTMTPIQLVATDPDGQAVTFSIVSGALPNNVSMSNSGTISGTPNQNDSYNAAGITHNFTVAATDSLNNATNRAFSILRTWTDGSSQALAATSANVIKTITGTTTDGAYWIKPPNCPAAFQVHCYMSIENGGWMLVLRIADNNYNMQAAGSFLCADYVGWGYTTKAQIDALGFDYTASTTTNTFTPIFAYSPFTDCMVISGRAGNTSKRCGWRHNTTIANVYAVTGGTSSRTLGNTILFGEPRNWCQTGMDIRSDTTAASLDTGGIYGFKINSDTHGATTTPFVGGWHATAGWYNAMIGYGRDNSNSGYSGGGIGGYTSHFGTGYFAIGHHYWGWGSSRNSANWNGDPSGPFHGHAFYIR